MLVIKFLPKKSHDSNPAGDVNYCRGQSGSLGFYTYGVRKGAGYNFLVQWPQITHRGALVPQIVDLVLSARA